MKFSIFACTVFFVVGSGDCGLVKDLFGAVHQEVHTVIDKAANAIGKVTHKISEPLGVFIHRKQDNSKNVQQSGIKVPPSTSIPKIDPLVVQTVENNEKINNADVGDVPNNVKADINYTSDNNNIEQFTASTVDQTTVDNVNNLNTDVSKDNTENILVSNDVKLEDILSVALLNDTHFKDVDLFAINSVRSGFPNSDTDTEELSNSTSIKTNEGGSNKTERDQNLVSDQLVFPDSGNDFIKEVKGCPKDLVISEEGNCVEPIDIDSPIKKFRDVGSVFEARCPPGYGRALDGSCQRDVGWSQT